MKVQIYLLNKTYIAEDLSTGLIAYGDNEQSAHQKLTAMVKEYWEKKKVIVPITSEKPTTESDEK
jgi:hypothetical protein